MIGLSRIGQAAVNESIDQKEGGFCSTTLSYKTAQNLIKRSVYSIPVWVLKKRITGT